MPSSNQKHKKATVDLHGCNLQASFSSPETSTKSLETLKIHPMHHVEEEGSVKGGITLCAAPF
jgi:hypothetical protein